MKKSLILISLAMAGVLLGVLCASSALAQNARPAPKNLQTTDADAAAADGALLKGFFAARSSGGSF